ncbi:translation initiation factor eIF-1A [Candidatus Bathyarchaeota archaeon]|nr:translation initiation factor eIF-1A [Candidatus Bathyarchaeota archaeon]MBS7627606.1 translation initiation factor eIF-1A [Candidatus Bathyarchaeota archaeon]
MGKRKVKTEEELEELVLPGEGEVLGIAEKLLGYDRVLVKCMDGHTRLCRIRGKMKRRVWIREGDVLLVAPWDFQFDKRGDITWRYKTNQVDWLRKNGYLKV